MTIIKLSVLTRLDEECELLIFEEWLDVAEGGRGPELENWAEFDELVLIEDIDDPMFCGVARFAPKPPRGPDEILGSMFARRNII